jgi:hypothetical protein
MSFTSATPNASGSGQIASLVTTLVAVVAKEALEHHPAREEAAGRCTLCIYRRSTFYRPMMPPGAAEDAEKNVAKDAATQHRIEYIINIHIVHCTVKPTEVFEETTEINMGRGSFARKVTVLYAARRLAGFGRIQAVSQSS